MSEMFLTESNIKVPAVTEEQMREIDRIAIEETGPNLFQMMENAGRNLALQAIEMIGENWKQARIILFAGTGGNGGGGICAARHLANRGANIGLVVTDKNKLSKVTEKQYRIYSATDGKTLHDENTFDSTPDLIIDALIGYSLHNAPHGKVHDLIQFIHTLKAPILSLDIPSGVDSTTGIAAGIHVNATATMTLALPKIGLKNLSAGKLILADIGIPIKTYIQAGICYESPFNKTFRVSLLRNNN